MKYRVLASDGTDEFFDEKPDADVLVTKKKGGLKNFKIVDDEIPFVTIHECGHDEGKPCINWERFEK